MIELTDITFDMISCIRNLWEKLNKLHYEDSIFFEDHYESFTFEKRFAALSNVSSEDLKITIVKDGPKF